MTKHSPSKPSSHEGGCLCGAVRYETTGELRDVVLCHCEQCRRTHGHYAAFTSVPLGNFRLLESRGLRWYQSSESARRGFCGECGASLFWEPVGEQRIGIAAGTLNGRTGLKVARHVYVGFAGDYYSIDDGLPQYSGAAPADASE